MPDVLNAGTLAGKWPESVQRFAYQDYFIGETSGSSSDFESLTRHVELKSNEVLDLYESYHDTNETENDLAASKFDFHIEFKGQLIHENIRPAAFGDPAIEKINKRLKGPGTVEFFIAHTQIDSGGVKGETALAYNIWDESLSDGIGTENTPIEDIDFHIEGEAQASKRSQFGPFRIPSGDSAVFHLPPVSGRDRSIHRVQLFEHGETDLTPANVELSIDGTTYTSKDTENSSPQTVTGTTPTKCTIANTGGSETYADCNIGYGWDV